MKKGSDEQIDPRQLRIFALGKRHQASPTVGSCASFSPREPIGYRLGRGFAVAAR